MKGLPSYPNPVLRWWRAPAGVPEAGWWYKLCHVCCWIAFSTWWRTRAFNRHHEPSTGSVLYICNHQSFLDPVLVAVGLSRPMNYMAREDLFTPPIFGRLIRSLGAFPVKRASADTGALKEALRRLKRGEQLTVFPEATRTRDGSIGPFSPGVAMLAKRAADWVVPTLIEGAFDLWPKTKLLPAPGRIVVVYDTPIHREEFASLPADEFLGMIRGKIILLQQQVRTQLVGQ
ncbi:MAG: 1-acyl-sn-glycerol-3-phosphate acyltransferase [Planctomycetes bacterium]|nr:1-acyl-sn-glycerol-3-phosphate acyltransferase [Planctomycetota bacterium]